MSIKIDTKLPTRLENDTKLPTRLEKLLKEYRSSFIAAH